MTILAERLTKTRDKSLDNLRGLAILVMIVDHCLLVFHGPFVIRHTLTRIAMPLFFIVGGHLVKRLSWRIAGIGVIGIFLPTVISFIDNPNVLVWYAVFTGPVILAKKYPVLLLVVVATALTVAANGYVKLHGNSYDSLSLFALMCLGGMISRDQFSFGKRIPEWIGTIGRFPVSLYVLHLFVLEALK